MIRMVEFEEPLSCDGISSMTGRKVSAEFVRAACHRAPQNHPLPHVRSGSKRPVIKVRWSQFVKWYEEEERLQVSA